MTIPVNSAIESDPRRSALATFYLAHERLAIGGGTLLAFLLLWEAFGRSSLVDPLFISSPTRVAQAGWELMRDRDFWNDLGVSGRVVLLGFGAPVPVASPLRPRRGPSKRPPY